jgi:uncharacterized protein (TIGR00251 family)
LNRGGAGRVWLEPAPEGGARLIVHVQPGAARSEVAGRHGDALKLRIASPAVEGAANAALIAYLAERLKLARREVKITRGDKSRRKTVWVALDPMEVERRLRGDST